MKRVMKHKYDAVKLADLGYGDIGRDEIELTETDVEALAFNVGGSVSEIESCRID